MRALLHATRKERRKAFLPILRPTSQMSPSRQSKGYTTEAELEARTQQMLRNPGTVAAAGGDPAIDKRVITYLVEGDSPKRDSDTKPRFSAGEKVFVKCLENTLWVKK
jgi:hypothetical protein